MWPFKKRVVPKKSPTLKQRVAEFWRWYATYAARFFAAIEDKRCSDLSVEVSVAVDRWLPGMSWVFGPGAGGIGHSFTLTGEGVRSKQFVAEYWAKLAPKIEGWTFYSSRQASTEDPVFSIKMHGVGEAFRPIEFWVVPQVNEQDEKIDLSVWHPSIGRVSERDRFGALFIILDGLLGEYGTQRWIREIKFSESQLQNSMPVAELVEFIAEIQSKHGWKQLPPTECYSGYQFKDQTEAWLRGDTVAGSSRYFELVADYLEAKGPCKHPLPNFGVDYVFVAIETSHFPKGAEVQGRGAIEDEIIDQLERGSSGISIGGATGTKHCYMDFAIYDGDKSIDIIREILKAHRVPKTSRLKFFTEDRAKTAISIW